MLGIIAVILALILAVLIFGGSPVLRVLATAAAVMLAAIALVLWWPSAGFDLVDVLLFLGPLCLGGAIWGVRQVTRRE